jgi:tRNA U55 pseudouridine synthase TruB
MAEQIKRYEIYMHSDDVQFLRECEDGDYVRLTDHDAALAAEQAKLGAEIAQRDARIVELEKQVTAATELHIAMVNAAANVEAERDTAREMLRDGRKWLQHTDIGCIESVPDMCVCGLDQFLASLKE